MFALILFVFLKISLYAKADDEPFCEVFGQLSTCSHLPGCVVKGTICAQDTCLAAFVNSGFSGDACTAAGSTCHYLSTGSGYCYNSTTFESCFDLWWVTDPSKIDGITCPSPCIKSQYTDSRGTLTVLCAMADPPSDEMGCDVSGQLSTCSHIPGCVVGGTICAQDTCLAAFFNSDLSISACRAAGSTCYYNSSMTWCYNSTTFESCFDLHWPNPPDQSQIDAITCTSPCVKSQYTNAEGILTVICAKADIPPPPPSDENGCDVYGQLNTCSHIPGCVVRGTICAQDTCLAAYNNAGGSSSACTAAGSTCYYNSTGGGGGGTCYNSTTFESCFNMNLVTDQSQIDAITCTSPCVKSQYTDSDGNFTVLCAKADSPASPTNTGGASGVRLPCVLALLGIVSFLLVFS